MDDFLLFGLDASGETAFSERLKRAERPRLRELAQVRLRDWPVVEVWDGQVCVVRLKQPLDRAPG